MQHHRNLVIILIMLFNILDIQNAKELMNTVLYISFGPVLILYFCISYKKVNTKTQCKYSEIQLKNLFKHIQQ